MEIRHLSYRQLPRKLLLMADPDWQMVCGYLTRAQFFGYRNETDEVIAEIGLLLTRPQTVEIVTLAVDESNQHQGLAKALLQFAIQWSQQQALKRIEIGTGNSSLRQLSIYQRAGFMITAIDYNYFVENYPNAIIENGIPCVSMIRLTFDL